MTVKKLTDLITWAEWGRQWVDYLQHHPELVPTSNHNLKKYDMAFTQICNRANLYLGRETPEPDIVRLAVKADEIQRSFQDLLRLVQEAKQESPEPAESNPASLRSQDDIVYRPIPVGGHKLPPLPYAYDALEPYIDEETMRIHHSKHHQSYVDGLNKAETMMAKARSNNDYDLLKHWEREAGFNGAGHYLHTIFWQVMSPSGGGRPQAELMEQIKCDFGSFEQFKQHFSQTAEKVEGGGWAILVWSPRAGHLEILMSEKYQWDEIPLLVLDVWEHSYYLSYRNNRKNFVEAWWNVVNWDHVEERFKQARALRWQPC